MIPAGYMAKHVSRCTDNLDFPGVKDIYSVSGCISSQFADYIKFWRHNGYWLFDSPKVIADVGRESCIDISGTTLFYYEIYEWKYDPEEKTWFRTSPEDSFATDIEQPVNKSLEGFDISTSFNDSGPEHSPLSCNYFAESIPANAHCLLPSLEKSIALIEDDSFSHCEPGPLVIYAVYTLPMIDWPNFYKGSNIP